MFFLLFLPHCCCTEMHQCHKMLSIHVWKRLHDDASLGTFFVWILFVFLWNISLFVIVVIVILRTLREHEIFKFTFKPWTYTEKRDNEQKSLKPDCGREVSSEVNSYSTHLPIVAFTAPQWPYLFGILHIQTQACTPTNGWAFKAFVTREHLSPVTFLLLGTLMKKSHYVFLKEKAEPERKAAQTDSAVTQMLPLEKSLLFSNH